MHNLLARLAPGSRVLDLGCAGGSFPDDRFPLRAVRLDLDPPRAPLANFVRSDASKLPFPKACFDGIVSNHSLEHLESVERCLEEMGRVLKPGGFLYIGVPDASTVTDKLYRWLSRGGGHINPFRSADQVIRLVERTTGLNHVATRTLSTSLSFLNRRNVASRMPIRSYLVGGGAQPVLVGMTYAFRLLDRWFGTRTSVYGWAFYFGAAPDTEACWTNVCVRCGSGQPSVSLHMRKGQFGLRWYACPNCGTENLFTDDTAQ